MVNVQIQFDKDYYIGAFRARFKWVSKELGEDGQPLQVRLPQETTEEFSLIGGFTAAGRHYARLSQLCAEKTETEDLYRDIYGREVLYACERFPCFDVYDEMNENRFYRWFYLRENGKLTVIYYKDGQETVAVTEDAAGIRSVFCEKMMTVWNCECAAEA